MTPEHPLRRDLPSQLPPLAWLVLAAAFWLLFALYFAPVLLRQGLLAPGDGEIYYFPFLRLPIMQLWNDNLLSGYPVAADIQAMTFYPLRWLSPSFNCLVIAAYVIAALGTFGLCLSLTRSRLGALVGALVVSGSGFMVGHLGHLSIIHAAAWTPAILWAVVALQATRSWRAVALGGVAVAMCLLGGHPQISIIGLLFSGMVATSAIAYALATAGWRDALQLFVRVFSLFALGLMLASPALVGLVGAAASDPRATWSLGDFNAFSLDFASLRLLWFPNLYGSQPGGPFGSYSGPFNLTELALYVGLVPWILGSLAVTQLKRDMRPLFWAGVACVSLLLALGASTPLGELVYRLPVLGKFRAQARFGWVFVISMGVLSSFGVSAVLSRVTTRLQWWMTFALVAAGGAIAVALVAVAPPAGLIAAGIRLRHAPAFMVPLVAAAAGIGAFVLFAFRRSHASALVVMAVMVLDLATFGWFHDWRTPAATAAPVSAPAVLSRTDGRVYTIGGDTLPPGPLRPNVNLRLGIPLITGYGPLLPARYGAVTGATTVGGFPVVLPDSPLLDVLGVQWIAGEYANLAPLLMGAGCGVDTGIHGLRAEIPASMEADAVRSVTHLSCSQDLVDGHAVADIVVADDSKHDVANAVVAVGTDTAEWAYDRPDVKASVKHSRAHVAESFDAGNVRGLWFEEVVPLQRPVRGGTVAVTLRAEAGVPFNTRSIEARDRATGQWVKLPIAPMLPAGSALGPDLAKGDGVAVRERAAYRGQAWMACEAKQASLGEMSVSLRARVAGGIDPFKTVLLEPGVTLPSLSCAGDGAARVLDRHPGYWAVETTGTAASMLVISSSFNSGWRATIDGAEAAVVPADGIVLGVAVPPGRHHVELHYFPRGLLAALVAAGLATIAVLLLLWGAIRTAFGRVVRLWDKDRKS